MSQVADFTEQLRVALADRYGGIERELGRVALKVLDPELGAVPGGEKLARWVEDRR
jgi:hypothetical protein